MSVIAVIPARSGSKRIKDKNITPLAGMPMMGWTIKAALETNLFDKVIVSTDSTAYQSIARELGASCDFLRPKCNDDITPVSEATLCALEQSCEYYNNSYDTIVQLMPNCPTRNSKSIHQAFDSFLNSNYKSIISGFEFGWMNPWWAHTIENDGTPKPLFAGNNQIRSQDLPKLYCPTGSIWISSSQRLKKYKTFYSPDWKFFILPWEQSVDIDDVADLTMASKVLV